MRKVFISMPMRGRTSEAIKNSIDELKMDFLANTVAQCEFINTIVQEEPPQTQDERIWYLGKSIQILSQATTLVVPKQREQYPGCQIEYMVGKLYGLEVIEYDILEVCPDMTTVITYYPTFTSEYEVFKYTGHSYEDVEDFFSLLDYSEGTALVCSKDLSDEAMCDYVYSELIRLGRPAHSGMVLQFIKDGKAKNYYCNPMGVQWSLIDEKDI